MAHNHNDHRRPPHHPLWNLVNSPLKLLATVGISLFLFCVVNPDGWGDVLQHRIAVMLAPYVGFIATLIFIGIGLWVMFYRPKGGGGPRKH